jgi:hypothetical protein
LKKGNPLSLPLCKRGIKGDFKAEDKSSPALLLQRRGQMEKGGDEKGKRGIPLIPPPFVKGESKGFR